MLFKFLVRFLGFFFHLFTETCLCHVRQTYFVFVFIFVKGCFFPLLYSWDGKEKKNLSFGIIFACRLIWSIYLILYYHLISLFNYSLHFLEDLKNTFATSERCALDAQAEWSVSLVYMFFIQGNRIISCYVPLM